MALQIHIGKQRRVALKPLKADKSPGEVEKGKTEWLLSQEIASVVTDVDKLLGAVQHNGGVGKVMLTIKADGDLGEGVNPIVKEVEFEMMPPLGATSGDLDIGDEEDIVAI